MEKIKFNVSAYTARLIGRENVSTLDGAILELVKNTYDADATTCILYYDSNSESIYILDNGFGMTEEIIKEHWMTIGNSSKISNFITKSGRVQTGAKGIGRFALDRVSDNSTMYTKTKENDNILKWCVDWSDFEKKQNLTDITADLELLKENKFSDLIGEIENIDIINLVKENFINSGTIFKMSNLREKWTTDLIESIKKSLASLIPPEIKEKFVIYFFNDQQILEDAIIRSQSVDKFDYKINFEVDSNKNVNIAISRNEFYFGDKIDEIIKECDFKKEDKEYFLGKSIIINNTIDTMIPNLNSDNIGSFNGELFFNKILISKDDKEKFYYKDIGIRKNYSETFGGIKIYRDNFKVRPYGEKNSSAYDWLALGDRRANAAAISHSTNRWRVATNQITGIVNISRSNIFLPDQSNRQGIVETVQFNAFKKIIVAIIDLMEEDRQYVGRKLSELYKKINPSENSEIKIIEQVRIINNKNADEIIDNSIKNIDVIEAHKVIEDKNYKIKNLEDENKMLRNLATTGIVSNQYIHESKQAVNDIGTTIMACKKLLETNEIEKSKTFLKQASEYINKLNSWFDVTLGSTRRDKRNMRFIDIKKLLGDQIELWQKALSKQNIKINFISEKNIELFKCFPYEIESIISNLIANSVYAFKNKENKIINISLESTFEGVSIIYQDNGMGLVEAYKNKPEKILEAFETEKINSQNEKIGTGLGMWIIRNIVEDYNGKINLEKNILLKEGFIVEIKIKSLKK